MRIRSLLFLVSLCSAMGAACSGTTENAADSAANQTKDDIVGGHTDKKRDNAVVALNIEGNRLCTGSLISPRAVLTARHCVSVINETNQMPAYADSNEISNSNEVSNATAQNDLSANSDATAQNDLSAKRTRKSKGSTTRKPAVTDPAQADPSAEDPAQADPSAEDPAQADPSAEDPAEDGAEAQGAGGNGPAGSETAGPQVAKNRDPASIEILVGEDIHQATAVARGASILVPSGDQLYGEDIAILILDRDVTIIKPLAVGLEEGVKEGELLRVVGFGKQSDSGQAGRRMDRQQVPITTLSETEFMLGESACNGDSGGPAIDEKTGKVVGVASRGGQSCQGADAQTIYTRVDAFKELFQEMDQTAPNKAKKAHASGKSKARVKHPPKRKQHGTHKSAMCSSHHHCPRSEQCNQGTHSCEPTKK